MKNVYIYCEGQTEEALVNEILTPYFVNFMIYVTPIVCSTKRTASAKHRGGVSDYNKIKSELTKLCRQHKNEYVTTMFDYYGMPENTPNILCDESDIYKRTEMIESAVNRDIGEANCIFHFMLHEFEGILFSTPKVFLAVTDEATAAKIQKIRDEAKSPEHINNSVRTAPYKRLEMLIPHYPKVRYGALLSKKIGIDAILGECKHFEKWIETIKKL